MSRLLGLLLAATVLMAQAPAEPERHDKYKDDPKAYCLPAAPAEGDRHGHECHCALMCIDDGTGGQTARESNTCALYCSPSHCACWPDDPCIGPPKT